MSRIAMTLALPDLTGASRMVFHFARALAEEGHEVVVAHGSIPRDESGAPASIVGELDEHGIETLLVEALGKTVTPFLYSPVAEAIGACEAVVGFNQRDRAVALKVAARLKVPGILAIGNQHRFYGTAVARAAKRAYYFHVLRKLGTRFVCTSETTRQELLKAGIEPTRCTVQSNGIEIRGPVTSAERMASRESLSVERASRVFLNVGRLDLQKGQDLLLRAWAASECRRDSDQLWLVGGSSSGKNRHRSEAYVRELEELVSGLGVVDSVRFFGFRSDVRPLLAAANGYIHAARWEGPPLPLATMEAMAAGLPLVITDCSGEPDGFVRGVHGYIARHDSADSLEKGICSLLSRSEFELERMGSKCREYAAEYCDIATVGRRFAEVVRAEIRAMRI